MDEGWEINANIARAQGGKFSGVVWLGAPYLTKLSKVPKLEMLSRFSAQGNPGSKYLGFNQGRCIAKGERDDDTRVVWSGATAIAIATEIPTGHTSTVAVN